MEHRFIGFKTRTADGEEFASYVRTYVYDKELNEFASYASGDPVADYRSVVEFCEANDFDGVYVISSSLDDLVFDVPGYKFDPAVGNYGAVVIDEADYRLANRANPASSATPRP
jgi:hypothetical protein|nr:hypothetical protein [Neorhizobium tomejilense]